MNSFKNHVYIAGRCTFCNINWLDEDPDNPDHDCIDRETELVYTTNSDDNRKNLMNKPFTTDPAYYEFLHKQNPHLTMTQIKEIFFDVRVDEI